MSYGRKTSLAWYVLVLLTCGMALMAKPTAVTFPVLMLLVDVWPLGRLRPASGSVAPQAKAVLWEKLPLFAMAGAAALLTFLAQRRSGAVSSIHLLSPGERIEN